MTTIKMRRASGYRWANINPVLSEGEPGFESNTGQMKIGDGETAWNDLPYFVPSQLSDTFVPSHIPSDTQINLDDHIVSDTPHEVYDDGPSLTLLYQNAKV